MQFKKVKRFLRMTGLWMPVPIVAGMTYGLYRLGVDLTIERILSVIGCSMLAPLYTWSLNAQAIANGVQEFPLIPTKAYVETHPDWQVSFRQKALRKVVPEELLSKKPEGIVLGKYEGKFVRVMPGEKGAAHTLVVGGSGSGKTSSVLLCTMLANQMSKEPLSFVLVDVKGELAEKGGFTEGTLKVFNPRDREQCGFDFFYDLKPDSTEEEVLEAMRRVVYTLFPKKHTGSSDDFWTDGPRNICLGLFLYGWREKGFRNLPDLVDLVLSKNLKELVNEVLSEVSEYSTVAKLLVSFGGEESAEETLSGLAMNLINGLQLIATDHSLRYLLRECEEKISPAMVDEGCSIDLQIEDSFLDQYAPILNLCLSTCISHLLARKESRENQKVLLVLDELGRITNSSGQVGYGSGSLQALLQIGRSKSSYAMLALQSWSALQGIYPEGAMTDMLANLPYRLILNASPEDRQMTEMVIKAFGKYTEKKRQVSTGKSSQYSYSFEEKDVLQEKDLLSLPEQNRVVLLSPYGAYMLEKCQYFKEKIFKKRRNKT